MCLGPEKRVEREEKRLRQFERAMPHRDYAHRRMTCLMCRRCRLTKESDFSQFPARGVVIYCENMNRLTPAHLTTPCPVADPRPAKPKKLHKLWVNHGDLGDYTRHATEVMLAYLRARWLVAPKAEIEAATGKTMASLQKMVRAYGIAGERVGKTRMQISRERRRNQFTPEQTVWLEMAYANFGIWPGVATYNVSPDKRTEIEHRKAYILEQTALRGPAWNWTQIIRHLDKRRAKANQNRKAQP